MLAVRMPPCLTKLDWAVHQLWIRDSCLLPFEGRNRLSRQSVIEVGVLPTHGEGLWGTPRIQRAQDDRAVGILKCNVLDPIGVERVGIDAVGPRNGKLSQVAEHVIFNVVGYGRWRRAGVHGHHPSAIQAAAI